MAAVWIAIGLVTSFVMGRLGHNALLWLGLGAIAGPASVVLVVRALSEHDVVRPIQIRRGMRGRGPIDVLVGVDGSPESAAALHAVVDLFGGRLGRLAVAAVADFDTGFPEGPDRPRREAEADLTAAAEQLAARRDHIAPDLVLLFGSPSTALETYADDNDFELLAIGRRGRGLATTTFGSVASQVARSTRIPVLIAAA